VEEFGCLENQVRERLEFYKHSTMDDFMRAQKTEMPTGMFILKTIFLRLLIGIKVYCELDKRTSILHSDKEFSFCQCHKTLLEVVFKSKRQI
jgi:hypothetical protein